MQDFWFYIQLGLDHVLDFNAYDHVLFLVALAVPFTFKHWKKVIVLTTVFTLAHCLSLVLSTYGVLVMDATWIEFFIPVTILLTTMLNLLIVRTPAEVRSWLLHVLVTTFFGLIHGFGFSNYFKMLMAEEEDKLAPLLGFATGIEVAQVIIVVVVLALNHIVLYLPRLKQVQFIVFTSILIAILTIPMLIRAFPM